MVAVPTCAVCRSTQSVQRGLQALGQAEPSSDGLLSERWVATQEHFLNAATKRAGRYLVVPNSIYEPHGISNRETDQCIQFILLIRPIEL